MQFSPYFVKFHLIFGFTVLQQNARGQVPCSLSLPADAMARLILSLCSAL